MCLCRKIFASWFIKSGIDSTTVDMLQGRCPPSVMARHYQAPSNDLKTIVLDSVASLQKEIEK
jgi:intergrase/recombinase